MAAIGSFLPWISITTAFGGVSTNGMQGDGIITLVVAVVVGLIAASRLGGSGVAGGVSVFPIIGALVIGAITVYDHLEVNERISTFQSEAGGAGVASVGAGIWILYVAAALMAFGWWSSRETRDF